jgi:WhiB family redox-sensing transcriptional regulator
MSVFDADDLDWRADAACLHHDPETFFPEPGPGLMAQYTAAKQICAGCPVRNPCLADAIKSGDLYGIRAGLGMKERRKLILDAGVAIPKAVRDTARCGTSAAYRAHRRRGEESCESCLKAERRRQAARRRPVPGERKLTCGRDSHAGYVQHQARREAACRGCLTAESAYSIERRRARGAA